MRKSAEIGGAAIFLSLGVMCSHITNTRKSVLSFPSVFWNAEAPRRQNGQVGESRTKMRGRSASRLKIARSGVRSRPAIN